MRRRKEERLMSLYGTAWPGLQYWFWATGYVEIVIVLAGGAGGGGRDAVGVEGSLVGLATAPEGRKM